MALRDQPYLPLYIQDIMTDEKLNECSASTHGIYIKGIMCLMHKSETYGKILLKQKFKQNSSKEKAFASMLVKHLPYTIDEIDAAITELIHEGVCHYEDDFLVQKRMVNDNETSQQRALAGKKGGNKRVENENNFAQAKIQANSEYEIEDEDKLTLEVLNREQAEVERNTKPPATKKIIVSEMMNAWMFHNPNYFKDDSMDFPACLDIAYKIAEYKKWDKKEVLNGRMQATVSSWNKMVVFVKSDPFLNKLSISNLKNQFQNIVQKMTTTTTDKKDIDPKNIKIVM